MTLLERKVRFEAVTQKLMDALLPLVQAGGGPISTETAGNWKTIIGNTLACDGPKLYDSLPSTALLIQNEDLRVIAQAAKGELEIVKRECQKLRLLLTANSPVTSSRSGFGSAQCPVEAPQSLWHVGRQSARNIWYGSEHVACAFQEYDAAIIVKALIAAGTRHNTVPEQCRLTSGCCLTVGHKGRCEK